MWNNWIGQRIRYRARMSLYWGYLLVAGGGILALLSRGHLADGLSGPRPVSGADLASPEVVQQLDGRALVFEAPEVRDTGAALGYAKRPDLIRARYLAAPAGKQWILVKVPARHEGATFRGLLALNSRSEQDSVAAPFAADNDLDPKRFLAYQLDATADTSRGFVATLFFLTALLVPGALLVLIG